MRHSPPELLVNDHAHLGEGPSWDSTRGRLYWVDIFAGHLHVYDPLSRTDEIIKLERWVGCAAPTASGRVILGLQDGIASLEPASGRLDYLARPENNLPGNRFNDGKCSPEGRFLAGTMDNDEVEASGALYSISPGGKVKTLLRGVRISNGLAFSPDERTLFYIDTPTRTVMAYDYDASNGEIANPHAAVIVPETMGWPDGMTSDTQGRLWVALWGGAAVTVWEPFSNKLVEKIDMPAKNVTSCAFGGAELNELYITSARKGLDEATLSAYPTSGGLFRLQTDVRGMPTYSFNDL